ncbi:MAG: acetyl-CoA C-acetyltransferase [Bowdeniella nasicola]|nr:acetyl-CoA C-acetyltransferase [Bowdeniella nasicola]
MNDVVILAGARTPQGRLLGVLAPLSAVDLGAHAIRHALERSGVARSEVSGVVMGQAISAGCGQNPARQAALKAGLDPSCVAETLNKVCLSGTAAILNAARVIAVGEAEVMVAGGMESMTHAPHLVTGARAGVAYGSLPTADAMALDGLTDAAGQCSMGVLTEEGNTERGLTRAEQDAVAEASHRRATAAQNAGRFDAEIAPIEVPQRRGEPLRVEADEGVRPETSAQTLARLRPAFAREGTITAGNSSPISDGAAAVVLASRDYADRHGLSWLARIVGGGVVAGPDTSLHTKPAAAIETALERIGWEISSLDIIEINEAFGAVVAASAAQLGIDPKIVNTSGGAIALGHPLGASGARLVLHAALELQRRGSGRAAVALCGGGGQGDAVLLER